MNNYFYSIYGPFIQQFLDFKRGLGYKYKDADWLFNNFDKFAMQSEETSIGIPKELADDWCKRSSNESEKSTYNRIQIIRQFSLFLVHLGYPSHIPKLTRFKSVFTPYIFSTDQVKAIFATCDQLQPARTNPKSSLFIIPSLFRLLYGTGIRISEAITLSLEDVNLKDKTLILRNCKNGKDRLIPLSDSLTQLCGDYLKYRNHLSALIYNMADSFFVSPEGATLQAEIAYKWFRTVLFKTGISHGGRGIGPRLHDLSYPNKNIIQTFTSKWLFTLSSINKKVWIIFRLYCLPH